MPRSDWKRLPREPVYNKCKGRCAYCGCPIPFSNFQIDHVWPRYHKTEEWAPNEADGGIHGIHNLLPACAPCNLRKNSLFLDEFREVLERDFEKLIHASAFKRARNFRQVKATQHPVVFYFEKIGVSIPSNFKYWRRKKTLQKLWSQKWLFGGE